MKISLFDSLTKKEQSLDLEQEIIKIYVCGPTVYDFCHVGHARVFIFFDALRRFFLSHNKNVIFVQNVTDVADKITKRAQELQLSEQEVVEKFTLSFQRDCSLLNVLPPSYQPRASDYIEKMITYIQKMLDKGVAYFTETGIYLDTDKTPYWQFENRQESVKADPEESGRSPHHFALWKFSEKHGFQASWGAGIPGWHIECTVMSSDLLGEKFDIHGGGADLKFPHHENEIAQCECLFGNNPAKIWVHSGMININGKKMSKSLQNFWYIKDFILDEFDADAFRYLILSHNYKNSIEITEEKFIQAKETMKNIRKYWFKASINLGVTIYNESVLLKDFDSAALLGQLGSHIHEDNREAVSSILTVLGFRMSNLCKLNQAQISQLVTERDRAKKEKRFEDADQLRKFLQTNFVFVEDKIEGTDWGFC